MLCDDHDWKAIYDFLSKTSADNDMQVADLPIPVSMILRLGPGEMKELKT